MRQFLATLTPAFLVGGCSWIYNPSNIKPMIDAKVDAKVIDAFEQIDARIDAAPIRDADPTMLTIDQVVPGIVYEGAGDANSRNALVVVHGHHMTQMATVTITGAANVSVVSQQISADGDWMAVLVHAAVDTTAATDSGTAPLSVQVTEPGASPQTLDGMLVLQNLPQLATTNGQSIAVTSLAPLYSQISGSGTVTFTGDADHQAILRAVSQISLGTVVVSGGTANKTTAGGGGPGGCAGGGASTAGGCPGGYPGGGGGAADTAGGGGGGNVADGAGGGGASGGTAGTGHGNVQIVNYVSDASAVDQANRAGGGGGGGAGTGLGQTGGAGGGGGGVLELDAGGDITVTQIHADGGGGGAAAAGIGGSAGGGGGGAGGIVVVRSQHGTVMVAATANGGGAGAKAGNGGAGGAGSFGQIRIDASGGTLPATTPPAHRGPMYAAATPQIVTDINPMVMMLGTTSDTVNGYDVDASGMDHNGEPMAQMFANGTLNLVAAMLPGYNKLCMTLDPGARHGDLADACIEIAYLP